MRRVATGIYEEIGEGNSLGKRVTGGALATSRLASLLSRTGAVADSVRSSTGTAIAVSAPGARVKVSSISKQIDEEKARFASVSPASIAAASGEHGFDKLKFSAAMNDQLPIHYKLFRIVDTALSSEANCERVFRSSAPYSASQAGSFLTAGSVYHPCTWSKLFLSFSLEVFQAIHQNNQGKV